MVSSPPSKMSSRSPSVSRVDLYPFQFLAMGRYSWPSWGESPTVTGRGLRKEVKKGNKYVWFPFRWPFQMWHDMRFSTIWIHWNKQGIQCWLAQSRCCREGISTFFACWMQTGLPVTGLQHRERQPPPAIHYLKCVCGRQGALSGTMPRYCWSKLFKRGDVTERRQLIRGRDESD